MEKSELAVPTHAPRAAVDGNLSSDRPPLRTPASPGLTAARLTTSRFKTNPQLRASPAPCLTSNTSPPFDKQPPQPSAPRNGAGPPRPAEPRAVPALRSCMACVKDGSRLSFSAISSGRYLFSGSILPAPPGSSGAGEAAAGPCAPEEPAAAPPVSSGCGCWAPDPRPPPPRGDRR